MNILKNKKVSALPDKADQKPVIKEVVRSRGLEPPRYCYHWHLKPARLPFRHGRKYKIMRNNECPVPRKSNDITIQSLRQ
jgi:hypothetical protein